MAYFAPQYTYRPFVYWRIPASLESTFIQDWRTVQKYLNQFEDNGGGVLMATGGVAFASSAARPSQCCGALNPDWGNTDKRRNGTDNGGNDTDERTYLSIVSWKTADARASSIAECQRRAATEDGARTVVEALRRMRHMFTSFQADHYFPVVNMTKLRLDGAPATGANGSSAACSLTIPFMFNGQRSSVRVEASAGAAVTLQDVRARLQMLTGVSAQEQQLMLCASHGAARLLTDADPLALAGLPPATLASSVVIVSRNAAAAATGPTAAAAAAAAAAATVAAATSSGGGGASASKEGGGGAAAEAVVRAREVARLISQKALALNAAAAATAAGKGAPSSDSTPAPETNDKKTGETKKNPSAAQDDKKGATGGGGAAEVDKGGKSSSRGKSRSRSRSADRKLSSRSKNRSRSKSRRSKSRSRSNRGRRSSRRGEHGKDRREGREREKRREKGRDDGDLDGRRAENGAREGSTERKQRHRRHSRSRSRSGDRKRRKKSRRHDKDRPSSSSRGDAADQKESDRQLDEDVDAVESELKALKQRSL